MNNLAQVAIFILGSSAIYLVGTTGRFKKWGYLVGLVSQPFWFYTAWTTEAWGIFFMCFIYTYSWANGCRNYLMKKS